jgi:hypothetical protein
MGLEIYAGPIVRKVTPKQVIIWVASLTSDELEVSIYLNDTVIGKAGSRSINLADKVFVHLAEVRADTGIFPVNQLLHYSIGVRNGTRYDYTAFEKIVVQDKLAYGNDALYDFEGAGAAILKGIRPQLPSFFIQGAGTKLNVLFGSCRKIHDKGVDAFGGMDPLIKSTYQNVTQRPAALFLGGDQIYADDVEDKYVLPAVTDLSKNLQLVETLPGFPKQTISYTDRSAIVKQMGFTSGAAKGHLLSLGEFVAMYGLVFNGNNWRGYGTADPVTDFQTSLTEVRRILANTPTYMMFDDHDVTDDWFITNRWKTSVLGNPSGKRVIANAMAAYFLFQGWGNSPENFDFGKIKQCIEDHVNKHTNSSVFDTYFLSPVWEFSTDTSPNAYFLDTRTNRDGDGFPPILKSRRSWDYTTINVANKNMPFVLVTAGPLLTFPGIDNLQSTAAKLPAGSLTGPYGSDYESWFINKNNYRLFFDYFKSRAISKIVVLSGDVHYGFSAVMTLMNKEKLLNQSSGYEIRCLQITSSALKNSASVLGRFATTPYAGTLWILIFKDNTSEIVCDKPQAEELVKRSLLEKLVHGTASTVFPNYSVFNGKLFKLEFTALVPPTFSYNLLPDAEYPDLVIELKIKNLVPKTADYIGEHNFGRLSIHQNTIEYEFNGKGPLFGLSM